MAQPSTVDLTMGQVAETTPVRVGEERAVVLGRGNGFVEVFHPAYGVGRCMPDVPVTEVSDTAEREQLLRAALAVVNDERQVAQHNGQLLEGILCSAIERLEANGRAAQNSATDRAAGVGVAFV